MYIFYGEIRTIIPELSPDTPQNNSSVMNLFFVTELDEFLGELEEDVEGMQTMILVLQQQLRESKDQIAALQEENTQLRKGGTYSPKHRDKIGTKVKTEEVGPFKCNVKKEESKTSKYSRTFSSNFTPMETSYEEKEDPDGDGEYGQGEGGYSQYDDDSYYEDYRENYSPYESNKDSRYSYDDSNEYGNGYEEQAEKNAKNKDCHEMGHGHEQMDVDDVQSDITSNSETHHPSAKEIKIEKTHTAHSEILKPSKHLDVEDAEMIAVSQERSQTKDRAEHEVIIRQQDNSSHHKRQAEMDQGNEEVTSTVDSSTHHSSQRENKDSRNTKISTSPQNKLTKDHLPDEVGNSDVQAEIQPKTDHKPLNESSQLTEKVSPNRTKGIQLLIEPKPPKDNSPSKDFSSDRHSPKPHLSPARTRSPKGNISPHKDKSPSDAGNLDGENSPQTNSASKDNSPAKDRSPNAATSPFKEREPVLQKFLNGVTSTVDDIEDL